MKCPHCKKEINIGALLGSVKSEAKAAAARMNAKKGGWPKGKKRGPRIHPLDSTVKDHQDADKACGREWACQCGACCDYRTRHGLNGNAKRPTRMIGSALRKPK